MTDYGKTSEIETTKIKIPLRPSIVRYTPPVLTWVKVKDFDDVVPESTTVRLQEIGQLTGEEIRVWNQKFGEQLGMGYSYARIGEDLVVNPKIDIDFVAIGEVIEADMIEIENFGEQIEVEGQKSEGPDSNYIYRKVFFQNFSA